MNIDKLTKTLLAAIAVALWVNVINPWIQPRSALADVDSDISQIRSDVDYIKRKLGGIARGICLNSKLC